MAKLLLTLSALVFFSSCSSLKELTKTSSARRTHQSERLWAVNNLTSDYNGFRRRHAMSPLIYKDYLIQGNSVGSITSYHQKDGQVAWTKFIQGVIFFLRSFCTKFFKVNAILHVHSNSYNFSNFC